MKKPLVPQRPNFCIVAPFYNEADNLPEFYARLTAVMNGLDCDWQVLLVDDGSYDDSARVAASLRAADPRVGTLRLTRNFGKELAMTAGLDHAEADATIVIDTDLQDPPELIPNLIARWQEGYEIVYAQRNARAGESLIKRGTAAAFYRLINWISRTPIPRDTGDYRLLDRRAVAALSQLRERNRFMKGLFAWVGYRQIGVTYQRDSRHTGTSKFSYWRLWNFAIDGITSFTNAPLKLATYLGLMSAAGALLFAVWVIVKTLLFGEPVKGYPSLVVIVLFLGGIQLIALGVIGEYLGRLFDESKQRPLYLVAQYLPPAQSTAATAPKQ